METKSTVNNADDVSNANDMRPDDIKTNLQKKVPVLIPSERITTVDRSTSCTSTEMMSFLFDDDDEVGYSYKKKNGDEEDGSKTKIDAPDENDGRQTKIDAGDEDDGSQTKKDAGSAGDEEDGSKTKIDAPDENDGSQTKIDAPDEERHTRIENRSKKYYSQCQQRFDEISLSFRRLHPGHTPESCSPPLRALRTVHQVAWIITSILDDGV